MTHVSFTGSAAGASSVFAGSAVSSAGTSGAGSAASSVAGAAWNEDVVRLQCKLKGKATHLGLDFLLLLFLGALGGLHLLVALERCKELGEEARALGTLLLGGLLSLMKETIRVSCD